MNKNDELNKKNRTLPVNTLRKLLTHEQSAFILSMINVPLIIVGQAGVDILKQYNIDYQEISPDDVFDLDSWLNPNSIEKREVGQFFTISKDLYLRALVGSPLLEKSTVYI